jgi:hypothetical protein
MAEQQKNQHPLFFTVDNMLLSCMTNNETTCLSLI